jgi:hypothetical protein
MILTDIDISWKFDYEMRPEEQEWHEHYVDTFKYKFKRWLVYCGSNSNYRVDFILFYFPTIRKFYISKISLQQDIVVSLLEKDTRFYSEYFTSTYPDIY